MMVSVAGCDRFGGGQAEEESSQNGDETVTEEQEEETVFAVSVTEAVRGELNDYLEVNGDVAAKTTVDAYPDNSGKLTELIAEIGDYVRKGEVIARVDPSRPGQQFEASPVEAPIAGTVINLPLQEGSTVSPQAAVARISTMYDLEIRTSVAEKFISRIEVGQPVSAAFEAFPGRSYRGRVREVSPTVDPVARTLDVKIDLIGQAEGLKAGMFGDVRIVTAQKENVVKIPADCLVERFEEDFIFVLTGDPAEGETAAVERRPIETGIEIDRKLEVRSGLENGERVVYRGQTLLEDGSAVRVVETVQPLDETDSLR
jgi:multidrug efflux pump subunit AcrA (membrane-fusion protein)